MLPVFLPAESSRQQTDMDGIMRLIFACCFACFMLVGCTPSEDSMDTLFGIEHNTVVLASSAVELSKTPVSFTPPTEAKVVGKETSVCVVLGGGIPIKSNEQFEREMQRLLNGATINASVTTSDGATHEFSCQGSGWAMVGRIVPSDEITARISPGCTKEALPVGSKIRSVSISSTVPVHALGVYWQSRSGD